MLTAEFPGALPANAAIGTWQWIAAPCCDGWGGYKSGPMFALAAPTHAVDLFYPGNSTELVHARSYDAVNWTYEGVDYDGSYPSALWWTDGTIHVIHKLGSGLRHCYSVPWYCVDQDVYISTGDHAVAVVDGQGIFNIFDAGLENGSTTLRHGFYLNNMWYWEDQDVNVGSGQFTQAATDAAGVLNVFSWGRNLNLRHGYFLNASWHWEDMDPGGATGPGVGVGVDPSGVLNWFTTRAGGGAGIEHGYFLNAAWHFETLDAPRTVSGAARLTSLNGQEHVFYGSQLSPGTCRSFRHGWFNGVWNWEYIDTIYQCNTAGITDSFIAAATYQGQLNVFHNVIDNFGILELRHGTGT